MSVYFIQAGEGGPIKIGFSDNVAIRLGDLQIAHWETLHIRAVEDGDLAREAALHSQFRHLSIRGEWHWPGVELLAYVRSLQVVAPADEPEPVYLTATASKLREYLTENEIPHAVFAAKINVSITTLYRYMSRDRVPHRDIMSLIYQHTDGNVAPNDFFGMSEAEAAA